MKVVHALGWYYPDSLGGTEAYVAGLARRLSAAGIEVAVAAPAAGASDENTYRYQGTRVHRYPVPEVPGRAASQGKVPLPGSERLHAWLAAERPDVFHLHTLQAGLSTRELTAARTAGARVVVTNHLGSLGYLCQRGTLMRWGLAPCDGLAWPAKCAPCALQDRGMPRVLASLVGAVPPAAGALLEVLPGRLGTALGMGRLIARNLATQRCVFELADRFVVLNRWALEALVANGAPRTKLVLNRLGFSQEKLSRKPEPREAPTTRPLTIGYLGRLVTIKGVHDLVRAVASMPRELAIELELRGPVPDEGTRRVVGELRALAGDDPRVRFAPPVAADEVPAVLAGYDLLCCPSIWFENGPTVAIEAHAVGTPVIGTRIGALAELITDGVDGRLVEPGDWRALAAVISQAAENPALVDRWRQALPPGRSMDDIADDYMRLYDEVLAGPSDGVAARAAIRGTQRGGVLAG